MLGGCYGDQVSSLGTLCALLPYTSLLLGQEGPVSGNLLFHLHVYFSPHFSSQVSVLGCQGETYMDVSAAKQSLLPQVACLGVKILDFYPSRHCTMEMVVLCACPRVMLPPCHKPQAHCISLVPCGMH